MERVEYGTDGNPYKLFVSTGIENKEQFPTVIPKAYAQNAIEEALKDTSENVLAIVREEYISKADYETRLKADMVAMLTELRQEIEMMSGESVDGSIVTITSWKGMQMRICGLIRSKIYELEGEEDGNNRT